MFSNLLQTASGILNSLICVFHFSRNFNNVLHKKVHENYWCCSSIACQEKGTDWILRIFTFNDKNRLYLPIISTLQFFEGQSDQAVTQLVIKPSEITPNMKNSGFEVKKSQVFPNPLLFFIYFFRQYLNINSETNPPPLMINVVCRYLR